MYDAILWSYESCKSIEEVFPEEKRKKLGAMTTLYPEILGPGSIKTKREVLKDIKYIFSTWGMAPIDDDTLKTCFPSLKAVFYAAGSVRAFAANLLKNGVRIFSAYKANAVPVSECVFAQILLSNKGFFKVLRTKGRKNQTELLSSYPGNYGAVVGIIGVGAIGSLIAEKLKATDCEVLYYDPYISREKADELGIKSASLKELFSKSDVITNHLPDSEKTAGLLDFSLFSLMKKNATFINSGRGRQVKEEDLLRALNEESGRMAILDVTYPEPPAEGSPLYSHPSVILTPHMDGSTSKEILRMADFIIEAFDCFLLGKPSPSEVTLKMLENMA